MTVHVCAACSTRYALELDACPHCGSAEREAEGAASGRLPLFATVSCASCARRWNLRLNLVQSGLIELPSLFCASCGSQVQVPWPPVEDDMPKITAHGGPSNARDGETSPVAPASEPLVGAEADQGHPSSSTVLVGEPGPELVATEDASSDEVQDENESEEAEVSYESMTLAELRAAAEERGVASYGTKAQIAERLREADQEA